MSFFSELKRRGLVQVGITSLVVAWGVAQVADLLLESFQVDDWVMQVVLVVLGIGCVVAVILAWIFDLRWDGIYRESELAKLAESASPRVQEIENESIAVLPFVNMSSDPEQEYFSDGISEELLNLLAGIPDLRVAARTSAFSYKGKDTKIDVIGRELGVAHVLEGSVRKSGNRVRITAQLIRADSGYHLWSETWDRTLEDIFDVQDEIAAIVTNHMKLTLLSVSPVVETDPKAYALYLQARHLTRQGTSSSYEQALELLQQALETTPDYAPAWRQLGVIYMTQADRGLRSASEGFRLGQEATQKALDIDPNNASAHSSMCRIALTRDQDLAVAARHMQIALSLNPADSTILGAAANMAQILGRLDTAIELEEYLAARDPVQPNIHANLGASYFIAERPDDAVRSYRTALRLSPDGIGLHANLGLALFAQDVPGFAMQEIAKETDEAFRLIAQAMVFHAEGEPGESDAALDAVIEKHGNEWACNIASVYAYRGDIEPAFEWLEKAVEDRDPGLNEIVTQPEFSNLYSDSRWHDFLTRIGRAPEQLDAIEFKVSLPS